MDRKNYQICTRCIMDTTDPEITFDEQGVCNHCWKVDNYYINKKWFPNEEGKSRLKVLIEKVKKEGKGKKYDAIMGLSGGLDSSYLAYQVKNLGLRPLAVHVDCGWNSEAAVRNIKNIVERLGFDLYTYVVDWEEMRDLQIAFLRSGLANQDVPQDHAIFAKLYNFANEKRIKYILSGYNFATECIHPRSWGHNAMDLWQLKAIHKRFGKKKLKSFPTISFSRYHYYLYIKKMEILYPLNYMPYVKSEARRIVQEELGWQDYGRKHHESRFTKFFQDYYLPTKFGFDKRRSHLSSLILSDQITRDEALREMGKTLYPENEIEQDKKFVVKKLGLTTNEFDELFKLPNKTSEDYPSDRMLHVIKHKAQNILSRFGINI